jgi:hypothetical protein
LHQRPRPPERDGERSDEHVGHCVEVGLVVRLDGKGDARAKLDDVGGDGEDHLHLSGLVPGQFPVQPPGAVQAHQRHGRGGLAQAGQRDQREQRDEEALVEG